MSLNYPTSPAALALNRFGLGARPAEAPPADPAAWLLAQFDRFEVLPAAYAGLADGGALLRAVAEASGEVSRLRRAGATSLAEAEAVRRQARLRMRDGARAATDARIESALATEAPFVERLVHFWANHFAISAEVGQVAAFAADFEARAIRPHVLGRFADMLLAVETHPAMLVYLNQINSVGPGSDFAGRRGRRGLNENLARETFELHTMGVRSGYTQEDVTEYARALTGWTVAGLGPGTEKPAEGYAFTFAPHLHEPGARTILGRSYAQEGMAQAAAVLADLARAPETAAFVATKLARHFIADAPPSEAVARLARAFRDSDGDLPTVYRALIAAPEAWTGAEAKFKTPWDWAISALRGTAIEDATRLRVARLLEQLGQPIWRPGSPAGWPDSAEAWAAPDALMRRVEVAARLAPQAPALDARTLAPVLLPGALSPETAREIARAESPASALALLLVSPEFLRR